MPKILVMSKEDQNFPEDFSKLSEAQGDKNVFDDSDQLPDNLRRKLARKKNFIWQEGQNQLPVSTREGATLTVVGGEAWLIGGVGEKIRKEIYSLDLKTTIFKKHKDCPSQVRIARFNHGAYGYQKKVFIFGGEVFSSYHFSSKQCTNDIWIFDTGS